MTACTSSATQPAGQSPSASPASLACRLPVDASTYSGSGEPPGGWITLPGGHFVRDPASAEGRLSSHVPSYDRALGRWVPVEANFVAPDGATYVLTNEQSVGRDFYLVDAATGARHFLLSGDGPSQAPASWTVVTYATEGIYLWSTGIGTIPGLWLLDPRSGAVRLVDGSHYWGWVSGGFAWADDPAFGGTATTYKVYRLDLGTGAVTAWYDGAAPARMLSPTPEGRALVEFGDIGKEQIELLTAPNQLVVLDVPSAFQADFALVASPGVWLVGRQSGVALYRPGHDTLVVALGVQIIDVAGGCY